MMPAWLRDSKRHWIEGERASAESFENAWERIFGAPFPTHEPMDSWTGWDTVYKLYPGGRIACLSDPGNGEIRVCRQEPGESTTEAPCSVSASRVFR